MGVSRSRAGALRKGGRIKRGDVWMVGDEGCGLIPCIVAGVVY